MSLLVGSIGGQEIFHDTPIAYRVGTNEIGTYQYSRWVESPVEMLKSKLTRMLNASGDYLSVATLGSTSDGQFVVRARLYAFEEVDGGSITGLVSMEFKLCDRKSGKVLWSHFYSESEPVGRQEDFSGGDGAESQCGPWAQRSRGRTQAVFFGKHRQEVTSCEYYSNPGIATCDVAQKIKSRNRL